MRILVLAPYFYPEGGGLERYVYNIFSRITRTGHEVSVIAATRDGYHKHEILDGIEVIRINPHLIASNTPVNFWLLNKIQKFVKSRNIDIINAHMPVPYFSDIASIYKRMFNNVPLVITYHNDVIKKDFPMSSIANMYNRLILNNTLSTADSIITPSPYCYHESPFLSRYKNKIYWIPPGVDVKRFSRKNFKDIRPELGLRDTTKIILFVGVMGSYHTHKGVDVLIHAFKKVTNIEKNVALVLVGKGDMIPHYKNLAEKLGIRNHVIFTGFVEEAELPNYYLSADIVTLPSINPSEGFGMTLIEAGAAGKTVIGSNVGGIKYIIKNKKTGLLVPPGDPEALAQAILYLLEHNNIRQKMGATWKNLVRDVYSWSNLSRATLHILRSTLTK